MEEKKNGKEEKGVSRSKKTELLKHVFSDDEKRGIGDSLALAIQKITDLEDKLASVSSNLKASIKEHEASVGKLANDLRQGYEYRDTPVEVVKDWNKCRVLKTRLDVVPHEVYEDREMTEAEKQKVLI